ncbi:hypothetical protein [Streptococcus orisratti]|uniref:hypothetical protein n=1 Tax=Streptococcus orisratti TaxID=114652 RepID=UPI003D01D471
MRKKVMRVILVLSSILLLSACHQDSSAKKSASSHSQTTSSSTAASSTEASSETTQSSEVSQPSDEDLYATTLDKVAADTTDGHATMYAFYDIDKNGTRELLTGYKTSEGQPFLLAIYYLQNGVSTYLSRSYVASAGGDRESTGIYTDGTVYFVQWLSGTGEGTAYLYQLRADNSGYNIVQEEPFKVGPDNTPSFMRGRTEIDLSQLDWKEF